jgi:hypothetical protein
MGNPLFTEVTDDNRDHRVGFLAATTFFVYEQVFISPKRPLREGACAKEQAPPPQHEANPRQIAIAVEAAEGWVKAAMSHGLDLEKVEAAFKRAAHRAVHGTREERSGRFILSRLVSATYDAVSGNLEVHFVNGRTYLYSNVPTAVYETLLDAESKGTFFNAFIRDHYILVVSCSRRSPGLTHLPSVAFA